MDPNNWNNGITNNQSNSNYDVNNQGGWNDMGQPPANNMNYNNQNSWNGFYENHETRSSLPASMGGKSKELPVERMISIIFGIISIVMIIVSFFITKSAIKFNSKAVEVDAVIDNIEMHTTGHGKNRRTSHDVFVEYEYEGNYYYDVKLSFYSSSMYMGKTITVLIDPDNPRHAQAKSGMFFGPILVSVMGVIFLIVSVILFGVGKKKR